MNAITGFDASLVVLALLVAGAFLVAVRVWVPEAMHWSRVGVVAWLVATGALAASGVLSFESMPPTMLVMLVVILTATATIAFTAMGTCLATRVPLVWLVGYQAFRIPVELWLHRGYVDGVFPVEMTYSGLNFDIVSGLSAVVVAVLVHFGIAGRRTVLAWNVMGLLLLTTIVVVALLSAPVPFRVFTTGPPNVYVTGFPGIWLPAVLVQAALLGHLLVFRRLLGTPE